jgi:hypothetical protein
LSVVYFTDRDLGKRFPAILQQAGLEVQKHQDHFLPNAADQDWLRMVGERGWVAITHDKRIRYKPNELNAVRFHRVSLLVVVGHARFQDLATSFVATRGRIERFLERHTPPFIAKVYRPSAERISQGSGAPGRIELWYP